MRLRARLGREAACRLAGFSAVSRRRARRLDSAEMSVSDGCATEREPSGGTREATPSAPMHPELGLPTRSIRRGRWPGSPRRGPPACSRGARRSQGRPRSGPSPPVGGVGFSAESRRPALAVCVSIRQRCASPSVSAGTPRSEHGGPDLMRGGRAGETLASPPAPAISSRFGRDAGAPHSSARSRELGRGWFSAESRRSAEMPARRASPRAWRRSRFGRDAPDREEGRRGRASGPTPPWEWTRGSS